jgi:hypothetical protein
VEGGADGLCAKAELQAVVPRCISQPTARMSAVSGAQAPRAAKKGRSRHARRQMSQIARLASISLAIIAPAAAASPMAMRLATRALGQPLAQSPHLGLQRRNTDGVQGLGATEESVKSDAVLISAEGAAVSAKDKLAQRLALQRTGSSASASVRDEKKPALRYMDYPPAEGQASAKDDPSPTDNAAGGLARAEAAAGKGCGVMAYDGTHPARTDSVRYNPKHERAPTFASESPLPHPEHLKAGVYAFRSTGSAYLAPHVAMPSLFSMSTAKDNTKTMSEDRATQSPLPSATQNPNDIARGVDHERASAAPITFPLPHGSTATAASRVPAEQFEQSSFRLTRAAGAKAAAPESPPVSPSGLGEAPNRHGTSTTPAAVFVQTSSPPLQHAAASMVETTKLVHAAAKAEIARLQESTKKVQEQVEQLSAKEVTDKNEAARTTKPPQGKNSLHEHDQAASSPASSGAAEKEDASIDRLRERANILSLITPPFHLLTPHVAPAPPRRPSAVAKALVPVQEQEQVFEGPSPDEDLDLADKCAAEKFSTQDYIQWLRSKFDVALDEAPYIHPPADAAASQQVEAHTDFRNAIVHARARTETKVKALETKVEALLQQFKDVATRHEHRSTALIVKHDMHSMHCTGASLSSCAFDALPPGTSSSRRPLPTSDLSSMDPGAAEQTSAPQDVHTLNYFHGSPRSGANENVPAHKPSAVPAPMRPAETWGMRQEGDDAAWAPSLADRGIFGVRLLAAIQEAERERGGGGSGGSYLLGGQVSPRSHNLPDRSAAWNQLPTTPARPHTRAAYLEAVKKLAEHQAPAIAPRYEFPDKCPFTPTNAQLNELNAREPTALRLARKAKSTMRAAGAAVSKLWSAAGKVLADEAKFDDWFEESQVHYTTVFSKQTTRGSFFRAQDTRRREENSAPFTTHGNWRRLFSRWTGGAQEAPRMSAEEEAFAVFFDQLCRDRDVDECSQDAKAAYSALPESRRQRVHLLEANLWGGLLAKRLEMVRSNPDVIHTAPAVWAPGKWAGVFVQDAYTQMEMELEISEVVPDGPCKGFITWAQGNSVTAFDGDVRGNQISFEEMRVVSDASDGQFVPGTRYRLWKDGGDGPGMEGTWLHPTLMAWGYLNLKTVDQALATTETQTEVHAHVHPLAQSGHHGTITGESPLATSMPSMLVNLSVRQLLPSRQLTASSATPPATMNGSLIMKASQEVGSSEPGRGMREMCLGLACLLILSAVLMPNRSKTAVRHWGMWARSTWLRVTRRRVAKAAGTRRETERGSKKATRSKPCIDIPAESFRAVGRTVLRNSSSAWPSPMSSACGSLPTSVHSLSSASLDQAREVLLSSSVASSSPSLPYSSLDYSNLQTSCEEEHQLSSLVELQNLRKSLRNENSGLLDEATQLTLDASWVCYDKADAEEVDDGSTHVGKAPRVSDTSAASTLTAIERRGSDTSDFTSDRRISLGWLAVEDALAASVSELTESDF